MTYLSATMKEFGQTPMMRSSRSCGRIAIGVALVAVSVQCASARADQIVTATENYRAAKIVGFEGGEVRLRTAEGKLTSEWVDAIKLMLVDRGGIFDDFNEAERFVADNQPARAIVRYRRTLRLGQDFWSDLIAARLVLACDAANQIDTTVLNWLRLLNGPWGGPPAAAKLMPQVIPEKKHKRTVRAVEQLDTALAKELDESHRALVELLRYEILRRSGDERAAPAARRAANVVVSAEARTPRVFDILYHALQALLANDVQPAVMADLDRAISDCPQSTLPDFLLLKGKTLLRTAVTHEQIIRAAWPLMRVPIHFADDPRAAEGLYVAALAMERMDRGDKAKELLSECLAHARLTEPTRRLAEAAAVRVRSGKAGSEP